MFNNGDWVVNPHTGFKYQVEPETIHHHNEILWIPSINEWCWFYNDDFDELKRTPLLGRYGELSWNLDYYDHCEPFIGSLPSIFKENT